MTRLLLALLVLMTPAAASADDDAQAKSHYERGQALYAEGRYREARAEFSRGYDLSNKPAFIFNMAECSRLVGEVPLARAQYKAYLEKEPTGKLAPLAQQRLRELGVKDAPPPAPVVTPPRAEPRPPGKVSPAPTIPPSALAVRDHRSDPPLSGTANLQSTPSDGPRPFYKKWPFWAAVGGGVIATGAIVYVATRSDGGSADVDWSMRQ